jgi:hypothetical protein
MTNQILASNILSMVVGQVCNITHNAVAIRFLIRSCHRYDAVSTQSAVYARIQRVAGAAIFPGR